MSAARGERVLAFGLERGESGTGELVVAVK